MCSKGVDKLTFSWYNRYMKTLTLKLKAFQNQDMLRSHLPESMDVIVMSLKQASEIAQAWIRTNDLGGGNVGDLKVYDGNKLVALISYNGRVWTTEKQWNLRKEII
jgi:hypothetical protein